MKAIVLFSHGSLLCGSGEALNAHAARLRERGLAPIVEVGYLNYSDPPFAQTVDQVVAQGATEILVMPYFLVPGKFIKVDLPAALESAQTAHPGIRFTTAEPLGFDPRLADALLESAAAAEGPGSWRADLVRAPHFCRANPECPLFSTAECPRGSSHLNQKGAEVYPGAPIEERRAGFPLSDVPLRDTVRPPHGAAPCAGLLVLVHGSPRPVANEQMFHVIDIVKERGVFPLVEVGFMECNRPSILEAIDSCISQGARQVIAVPYFLHTGTHVADDLPTLLEQASLRHPNIEFRMGRFLGAAIRLTDILETRIQAAPQHP